MRKDLRTNRLTTHLQDSTLVLYNVEHETST